METEKLFYADPFLTEFDARVLACEAEKGGYAVVLDRTAFYPEGGGQPYDTGVLGGAEVLDVHEKAGVITHKCASPLPVGETVHGRLDWARRFDHMQQHSGEHICSGLICARYGCDNVGFHMGAESVTIDFNADIPWEELLEIEAAANRYIYEDHAIDIQLHRGAELDAIDYRSKKPLEGDVRIVTFPGADCCACCGTHVMRSGQVGIVKFLSVQKFREGVRIELLCGGRAYRYLAAPQRCNRARRWIGPEKDRERAERGDRLSAAIFLHPPPYPADRGRAAARLRLSQPSELAGVSAREPCDARRLRALPCRDGAQPRREWVVAAVLHSHRNYHYRSRAAVLPPAADGEGPRARGGLRRRRKCLLRDGGVAAHRPAVEVHRQHFLENFERKNFFMETEKLYYADPFLTEFDARVLACEAEKGGYAVVLDRTAFYPEGGGQPYDTGVLGGVEVSEVHEKAGVVTHKCAAPLPVGETVHGKLDWARRFDHMQQHSGEHICSGLICALRLR